MQTQNQPQATSSSPYETAVAHRESGRYKEASAWLQSWLSGHPQDAEAYALLGYVLLLDKQHIAAGAAVAGALAIAPGLPAAQRNYARLLLMQQEFEAALQNAQAAYQSEPQNPENWLVLAVALGYNNQNDRALPLVERALQTRPDYAEAYANRAVLKLRGNDPAGALADAEKALDIKPHLGQLWGLVGGLRHQFNNLPGAIEALEKALEYEPENVDHMANLGEFLRQNSQLDAAVTLLQKTVAQAPDHAGAWANFGTALQEAGRIAEAREAYAHALKLAPQSAEIANNLGALAKADKNWEEALRYFDQALAIKPDHAAILGNRVAVLIELERYAEAAQAARQAARIDAAHIGKLIILASALTGQQRYDEALSVLDDLVPDIDIRVEDRYCLANAYADLYRTQGRWADAEVWLRKALVVKPDAIETYCNLGFLLAEQGELNMAINSFRRALLIRPDYAEAHNNLGNVLKDQGKPDEAVASYQKAVSLRPAYAEAFHNLAMTHKDLGTPTSAEQSVYYYQKAFSARTHLGEVNGKHDDLSNGLTEVFLELTNKCNFHCDFCPSDSLTRPRGYMSMDLIRKVCDEVKTKRLAPQISLHLMGEPTLHPDFFDILEISAAKNLKLSLVSNGSTLNAKSIPKILGTLFGSIVVSLQTPTHETYKHRGEVSLSWERYIGNIRLLVHEHLKRMALKQTSRNSTELRVMITKDSKLSANIIQTSADVRSILHEWNHFVSGIEQELGLPPFPRIEMLETAQEAAIEKLNGRSYPLQQGLKITFWQGFSFANSRLSNEYRTEPSGTNKFCDHPFIQAGILWNGDVTLCCFDYDGQLAVGNIRDDTIEAVLNGEKARNLRAAMLSRHPLPMFCRQCQAEVIHTVVRNLG